MTRSLSEYQAHLASLEAQLISFTRQKLTPASKRSPLPATEIHVGSLIFTLATIQQKYEQEQELIYQANCKVCRRKKAVIGMATYLKRDAVKQGIWPDRCPRCQDVAVQS